MTGDAILLLHFMLECYRFDFECSRSKFHIELLPNLFKWWFRQDVPPYAFLQLTFMPDNSSTRFFANWALNDGKKLAIKYFKCNRLENFGRDWAKKCYTKIDFTCKSLFDSNVVDTCRIFTFWIYFSCSRMALWHCQTRRHENRIFRTDTQRTPFWHRKNYANEITCKLSAQHATRNEMDGVGGGKCRTTTSKKSTKRVSGRKKSCKELGKWLLSPWLN